MRSWFAAFILLLVAATAYADVTGSYNGAYVGSGGGRGFGVTGSITGGGGPASGPPTVTALAPNAGSVGGGNPVVLTGTNFQGVTAVAFGANPATSFSFINAFTILSTAPAGTGVINVTVTTPLGTSATGAGNQYTYNSCTNSMDFSQPCNTQYGF